MSGPTADGETVHATLVALAGAGVLLRGASGAGKSDLALRLIGLSNGWQLVSDYQVVLSRAGNRVVGRAPAAIAGKLEVRGLGVVEMPAAESADVRLIVDLVARQEVPRLPLDGETAPLLGLALPRFRLNALDASAPDKVALLLAQIDKL